jgi:membrane-bound lytic murein transglycosylase B
VGRLNIIKKLIVVFCVALTFSAVYGLKPGKADMDDHAFVSVRKLLSETDVTEEFLIRTFSDTSVRIYSEIPQRFKSPYEKRPYSKYRKLFITNKRIERGVAFFKTNKDLMMAVTDSFGVDPMLLLSISGIESNHGNNHGGFLVFSALYTTIHTLPNRENWAAKELAAFLLYCYQDKIDPHSLSGSYAGAFGFGQFIPSSFNHYAIDFNGDDVRQPYEWPDVLASIANYLLKNGYDPKEKETKKGSKNWNSIYAYNHSENYVEVVLELSEEYRKRIKD